MDGMPCRPVPRFPAGFAPWAAVAAALVALPALEALFGASHAPQEPSGPGYTDTPLLPGSRWRVHDAARPRPEVVRPGADCGAPPSDAVVLFDGSDLDAWSHRDGRDAEWAVADGAFVVEPGSGDLRTREEFGAVQLHLEWRAPTPPEGASQHRGNSGLFLMGRYEVQILDSWDNPTYADGQAAALYGQAPPLVNASRPPGEWQSYDLVFTPPRFDDDGGLVEPARITLFHDGVAVQVHQPFLGSTVHRAVARYEAHPPTGPIVLQDHGQRVAFRNVWVRRLEPLP